jgi:hypothetical protein
MRCLSQDFPCFYMFLPPSLAQNPSSPCIYCAVLFAPFRGYNFCWPNGSKYPKHRFSDLSFEKSPFQLNFTGGDKMNSIGHRHVPSTFLSQNLFFSHQFLPWNCNTQIISSEHMDTVVSFIVDCSLCWCKTEYHLKKRNMSHSPSRPILILCCKIQQKMFVGRIVQQS